MSDKKIITLDEEETKTSKALIKRKIQAKNIYAPNYNPLVRKKLRELGCISDDENMIVLSKFLNDTQHKYDGMFLDYEGTYEGDKNKKMHPYADINVIFEKQLLKHMSPFMVTFSRRSSDRRMTHIEVNKAIIKNAKIHGYKLVYIDILAKREYDAKSTVYTLIYIAQKSGINLESDDNICRKIRNIVRKNKVADLHKTKFYASLHQCKEKKEDTNSEKNLYLVPSDSKSHLCNNMYTFLGWNKGRKMNETSMRTLLNFAKDNDIISYDSNDNPYICGQKFMEKIPNDDATSNFEAIFRKYGHTCYNDHHERLNSKAKIWKDTPCIEIKKTIQMQSKVQFVLRLSM